MDRGFGHTEEGAGGLCVPSSAGPSSTAQCRDIGPASAAASAALRPAAGTPSSSRPYPHPRTLPLKSLNHVSIHCKDVQASIRFYRDLMGFVPVKRPSCLDYFDGAWLFNYGIGIHLLKDEADDAEGEGEGGGGGDTSPAVINPRSDHVSFQCEDIEAVEAMLDECGVPFVRQAVVEHGIEVQQLFFHDPDNHMIEICNCDALPVEPLLGASTPSGPIHTQGLQGTKSSPASCPALSAAAAACGVSGGCSRRASLSHPGSPAAAGLGVASGLAGASADGGAAAPGLVRPNTGVVSQVSLRVGASKEQAGASWENGDMREVGHAGWRQPGAAVPDPLKLTQGANEVPCDSGSGQSSWSGSHVARSFPGGVVSPHGSPLLPSAMSALRNPPAPPALDHGSFMVQNRPLQVPAGV